MTIPEIRKLYRTYHTPAHVQQHMQGVAEVAVLIAQKIKKQGYSIDVSRVRQLALVHDLMKAIVFKNITPESFTKKPTAADLEFWKKMKKKYEGHDAEATSKILKTHKEIWLSRAVLSQQFDAIISREHPLATLEEKVVYYADKRVAHSTIVPLKERLQEGYKRYSGKKPKSKKMKTIELAIHMLEEEIFSMTGEKI